MWGDKPYHPLRQKSWPFRSLHLLLILERSLAEAFPCDEDFLGAFYFPFEPIIEIVAKISMEPVQGEGRLSNIEM